MRWRITLAFSILISLLVHRWVRLDSGLSQFLIAGLSFSIVSRTTHGVWNYLAQRQRLAQSSNSQELPHSAKDSSLARQTESERIRGREIEPPLQH